MFSKLFCVLFFATVLDASVNSRPFGSRLDCFTPNIENGKVRTRLRSRVIKFTCNNKYTLVGNRYASCYKRAWDEPIPPVCVKSSPNCPITPVENGIAVPTYDNAFVTFFCLPGYNMLGNRTMYCDGHRWVGAPPQCINSTSQSLLSCDFETPDLCGWKQDEFHDFDWRRWNKKTPSSILNTGPDFDHTLGKYKSGYYMYIESTSVEQNSSARLISPIYDLKLAVDGCFNFYYHMYGMTTGGLRVYQVPYNLSSSYLQYAPERSKYLLFEKWGNQGNAWFQYSGKLNDFKTDFQIVIEGIRGPDFLSDIAIDDVELLQGENCTTTMGGTYSGLKIDSCVNRCQQNDTDGNICSCSVECFLSSNCCPDFYDTCMFTDRFTSPYDDLPSGSIREKMPQTETTFGTDVIKTSTTPETTVTTPTIPITTTNVTVNTSETSVAIPKITLTTPKITVTTSRTTFTLPTKTTTTPTPTTEPTTVKLSTTKKSIPKLVFKTTESVIKHADIETEKTTVKPVTLKPVTVKPVTVKVTVTAKPATITEKITKVEFTTVKPQLTTALNKLHSSKGVNSQETVSANEKTIKSLGMSTTSIVFLTLGILCIMGSAVWFLRSAHARRVIIDLRGRSARDPEVRYLTSHADED